MLKIRHFIEQSWLLIAASFCFGLLIATTNSALSGKIKQNEQDKLNALMKGLISGAVVFQEIADTEKTDIYKAVDSDNRITGFAFIASGSGFADKIKVIIAVDKNCEKFFGFDVLSSKETPGFGSRITDDFFRNQFKDAPAEKLHLVKTGDPEKIDNRIVAISGATVSSEAVVKIFNGYIANIKEQLQTKGLIENGG